MKTLCSMRSACSRMLGRLRPWIAIAVTVIGLGAVSEAMATTWYVNNSPTLNPPCSDTGPGTALSPFCTIGRGATVAVAGDTVSVASGTYPEQVTPKNSGTAGAPIVYTAAAGANVVVGNGQAHGFSVTSSHSYITIQGFTVSGTTNWGIYVKYSTNLTLANNHVTLSGQPVSGYAYGGIYLNSMTASVVSGSLVDYNTDSGIYLINSTTGVVVKGNTSTNNARQYTRAAPGIDVRSPTTTTTNGNFSNIVIDNISHDNEDSGIQLYNGASGNLVVNNLCYHNGDHGIDDSSSPAQTIIGNTVYLNTTAGINVEGNSTTPSINTTLENNISVDNALSNTFGQKGDIRVDTNSIPGTTLDYDLVFLTQPSVLMIWGSTKYSSLATFTAAIGMESHGLQADPLWVSPATFDFHLTAESPAIDSADSGAPGEQTADLEGRPRVDDPNTPNTGAGPYPYYDRGAFEFQR